MRNFSFGVSTFKKWSDLRARLASNLIFKAAAWSTVAFVLSQFIRIGGNLIMTRILAPEMFGVMNMVLVVLIMLNLFADTGVRNVVIQSERGDEPVLLNTAWSMEIIRGAIIWLACLGVSAWLVLAGQMGWLPAGSAWAAPELPLVLAVSTFSAVVMGLQSTNLMTATRQLQLKRISIIELVAQCSGLISMIIVGWLTGSIWALVVGAMVTGLMISLLSHVWLEGISNRLCWDWDCVYEIYRTGRWIMLSSIVFVFSNNVDRLVLAGFVSASVLGLYSIALNLLLMVESIGSRLIFSVVLPALSETARTDRENFRNKFLKIRLPIDIGFLAAAGLFYAIGPAAVDLMYDDRYREAGLMLQILSFSLVFSRFGVFNSAYIALGQPQLMAWVHVVKLVSIIGLLLFLFDMYGLQGALYAVAFHALGSVFFIFWANRGYGLNSFRYEVLVLPAWFLGYGGGLIALDLLQRMFGSVS